MSKFTNMLVCIVLTSWFCFASSVCFGSFCLASSETGVSFLEEDYCTHQFAWVFLFSWDRCLRLSFSLLTLFVIGHSGTDMIQIYRCSRIKSAGYFVLCIYNYAAMVYIRHYFISWRYLVRCSTNAIACQITQLLRYCEKDNLCSLLDSGRQIFPWSKLTLLSPWVQPWVQGRNSGSFPEQRLVIEPKDNQPPNK